MLAGIAGDVGHRLKVGGFALRLKPEGLKVWGDSEGLGQGGVVSGGSGVHQPRRDGHVHDGPGGARLKRDLGGEHFLGA